jgi:hypothetical protein
MNDGFRVICQGCQMAGIKRKAGAPPQQVTSGSSPFSNTLECDRTKNDKRPLFFTIGALKPMPTTE